MKKLFSVILCFVLLGCLLPEKRQSFIDGGEYVKKYQLNAEIYKIFYEIESDTYLWQVAINGQMFFAYVQKPNEGTRKIIESGYYTIDFVFYINSINNNILFFYPVFYKSKIKTDKEIELKQTEEETIRT